MRAPIAAACLVAAAINVAAQQQLPRYRDEVDVNRVLVDVRAVDGFGQPITGLQARSFKVKIDGRSARVETAAWVADAPNTAAGVVPPATPPDADEPPSLPGRLIVFLFQKDLEPSRIVGLMRMLLDVRGTLSSFGPDDRVAVLSYDSRLHVLLDLTNDFGRVRRVLSHDVLFGGPRAVDPPDGPSLLRRIGAGALARAYPIERALSIVGSALEALPGAKSLVLVGYGFGRLTESGLEMENGYGRAVAALQRARASVFCLDVTDADDHSLEGGLELVAAQTGGFYAKTHLFPQQALDRLSGALSGYYSLFVDVDGRLTRGPHGVQVELSGVKGNILATDTYIK